jgi:hypothetical protein
MNAGLTERVRALGVDAECSHPRPDGFRAELRGRSNNRREAERLAALLSALTGGRSSIWERGGQYIVNARPPRGAVKNLTAT